MVNIQKISEIEPRLGFTMAVSIILCK